MTLLQDLRFAARTLRKSPAFTIAAALALALGIGANTAMFSVIDGVLLRPLPYSHSEELVNLWETNYARNIPKMGAAPGNYLDWRTNKTLASIAGYQQSAFSVASTEGEPERYLGAICSPGFFHVLEVNPILGRTFTEEENAPGRDGVVILGYGVWKQRFGGDPKILGQTINSNGRARQVIGVMPPGFDFPDQAVMWSPLGFDNDMSTRRDFHRLRVIGRLKPGATLEQAQAEFATMGVQLAKQYPFFNQDAGIAVFSTLDDAVGKVRPSLLVLFAAVAFVLLIACANVANLLLAKAAGRQREIAIRTSLGAGRGRIIGQMLTESLLLALLSGAIGLALAYGAFRGLLLLAPANIPRLAETALDWQAAAFTLAVSLVTGVLFGLAPAWHASKSDVHSLLKEGARGTARNRLRSALVVGQVAAALILLTGAGLLIRSFYEIAHVDPGFDPNHVETMRLALAPTRYQGHNDRQIEFARAAMRNVGALPGVQSAAVSTDVPLLGNPGYIMRFEGRPPVQPSQAPVANYFAVTPSYFDAMRMRITRGRGFSDSDNPGSPLVVVVNQTLVDRYFPGQDPIGKRLEIAFSVPPNWRLIVGVVADVKIKGLDADTPVQVYAPFLQIPSFLGFIPPAFTVLARTTQDPALLGGAMKAAILAADRSQPVFAMQPMTEVVAVSVAQQRFSLVLLMVFAGVALLLAAIGLYGVMSYVVTQRTSEIGLRMALGAQQSQVLQLVQRQGMALVASGLVLGVVGGLAAARLMKSLLFHVRGTDPWSYLGAAAALTVVAFVASYFPARRAARVDPLVALRYE